MDDLKFGIAPSRSFIGGWEDMLAIVLEHGFIGVEFKYELPFILPGKITPQVIRRIKKTAHAEGLFVSLHAPYVNIGALLPSRWEAALAEHRRALACANELGAETYTVHSGWVEEKYSTPALASACRDLTVEAVERMREWSDGVKICIENQNGADRKKVKCAVSTDQLHYIAAHVSNPVYYTFDIGHANVFASNPTEFLLELGPERVKVGHIHDNDGTKDSHQALGTGTIDWRGFLSAYRKHNCDFPLLFELSQEEEFLAGRKLLKRIWSEVKAISTT